MKNKNLKSAIITVIVLFLLIYSGPASAIVVTIDGDTTKNMDPSSTLAVANMNATINIQATEIINIQNYTIKISNSSGTNIVTCSLYANGTELNGCSYINNSQVSYNSNYTSGDYYGYGYTTSGSNETYGSDNNTGYGYGDKAGAANEVVITFDWEFQKQAKSAGVYNVNLQAYALNDDEAKIFTSVTEKSITLNSISTNETITATESATATNANISGTNVSVAANVGYIETSNMSTNVSTYVKGIVGVSGNVSINVSLGTGIGGVSAANLTTDSDDTVLNLYLDINGTVDADLGYADIYIAILKTTVDVIDSDAKDNLKAYVKHNDGTESTYDLNRVSGMDTATEYMFRIRITSFSSIFGVYYSAPSGGGTTTTGGGGGSSVSDILLEEVEEICIEDWICTDWEPEECPSSGEQTRKCEDWNDCGTTSLKPDETRACDYIAPPVEEVNIPIKEPAPEPEITEEKEPIPLGFGIISIVILAGIILVTTIYIKKKKRRKHF